MSREVLVYGGQLGHPLKEALFPLSSHLDRLPVDWIPCLIEGVAEVWPPAFDVDRTVGQILQAHETPAGTAEAGSSDLAVLVL